MGIRRYCVGILIFVAAICCSRTYAYSVLTHEAIIDASWEKGLKPLLLVKYPGSTDSQLIVAHSYAYGGAIAPDMDIFLLAASSSPTWCIMYAVAIWSIT